jgi:DNA invertase Pin-like site-specific DNA recombinase
VNGRRGTRGLSTLDSAIVVAMRYRRVSSKDQSRKGISLPTQDAETLAYIGGKVDAGWTFGDDFEDVQTGRRSDRDGYQRMLAAIRSESLRGRRVVVVLVALDRLGRDLEEGVRAWNELKGLGVEIHAVRHGGLVTEVMFNLYMTLAQEESRKIGERVQGAWRQVEETGWHRPGRPAWGYTYRPRTDEERGQGAPAGVMVPHETEAAYARELWARYAAGESGEALVRWTAVLPESAKGPRRLHGNAIRELLRLPVYVGRHGGVHDIAACVEAGDRCAVLDLPRGRWEPLIDDATWMAVHRQYRRQRRLPSQASGEYLLSGLLRCPKCGGRMVGNPGNRRRAERDNYRGEPDELKRYLCASRLHGDAEQRAAPCYATIMAKKLDPVVVGTVADMLDRVADLSMRPKLREHHRRVTAASRGDDPGRQLAGQEAELARLTKMLSRTSQEFFAGGMTRLAYDATVADVTEQIEQVTAEIARLRDGGGRVELEPIDLLLAAYGQWGPHFRGAPVGAQRAVLADLVEWVRPLAVGSGRSLRYEVSVGLTRTGRMLLEYACAALAWDGAGPTPNLVAVRRLATTNWWTATPPAPPSPLAASA